MRIMVAWCRLYDDDGDDDGDDDFQRFGLRRTIPHHNYQPRKFEVTTQTQTED